MAQLDEEFDSSQHEPRKGLGGQTVAPGDHIAAVSQSEYKPTKNNPENKGILFTFSILDGPEKGKTKVGWINYVNANKQAQDIGRAELSTLMQAVGLPPGKLKETALLHNRPFMLRIVADPTEKYPNGTKIDGYQSLIEYREQNPNTPNGAAPAASAAAPPEKSNPPQEGGMPWS